MSRAARSLVKSGGGAASAGADAAAAVKRVGNSSGSGTTIARRGAMTASNFDAKTISTISDAGKVSRLKKMGGFAVSAAKKNPKATSILAGAAITGTVYGGYEIDRLIKQEEVEKKRKICNTLCTKYNQETSIFEEIEIDDTLVLVADVDEYTALDTLDYAEWDSELHTDIFIDEVGFIKVKCNKDVHMDEGVEYIQDICGDHCEGVCKTLIPDAENKMKKGVTKVFNDMDSALQDALGMTGKFMLYGGIACLVVFLIVVFSNN